MLCCWPFRRTSTPSRWSTAREVKGRGIEEAAPLGVSAAAASFKEGNLMDGLISAVRVLSAGVHPA